MAPDLTSSIINSAANRTQPRDSKEVKSLATGTTAERVAGDAQRTVYV